MIFFQSRIFVCATAQNLKRYLVALLWVACAPGLAGQSRDVFRLVLPNVQFSAEKSDIGPAASLELEQVADLLQRSPGATAEIGAHTDAAGNKSYNLRLSQQRAQAVMQFLVKKGVAAKRLKAKGYGESKPLNRCRRGIRCPEAERRQNRRIELTLRDLPSNPAVRAEWQAWGVKEPARAVAAPQVPKMPASAPATSLPKLNAEAPPQPGTARGSGVPAGSDYFPELRFADPAEAAADARQHVPQPLPATFIGYTVEVVCQGKPLLAGNTVFRKFDPVFLRYEAGGEYCYYIGAFHTLAEAAQFCREQALPKFPGARVAAFANDEKKYFNQ